MDVVTFTLFIFMIVFIGLSILSCVLNISLIQKQRKILFELDKDTVVRQSENF